MPRPLMARPLTMARLASASLAIAAPATAHGAETGSASHSRGWLGSLVDFVASHLPGSGMTSGNRSASSPGSASHGTWWTSGSDESDDNSHHGAGDGSETGETGLATNGSGNTGAGAGSSTDVPEPGMLGLFGAGLIPLALPRRARLND